MRNIPRSPWTRSTQARSDTRPTRISRWRSLPTRCLIYQQLVAPLAQYADRFYNIRGVQTSNQTIGGIGWDVVPGAVPNVSPISDQPPPAPGDNTQPAWTARLVTLPANHCRTVQGAIDHMFMMEYAATQQPIASVL